MSIQWENTILRDSIKMGKLYRAYVREAANGYRLTPNEISVLLFLHRYAPAQDTSTEISQQLGISKALVARSVDSLYRRGFVQGERDTQDRRIVHLHLCGDGALIAKKLHQTGCRVTACLQHGISEQELETVQRILNRMQCNLDALLEQMEGQVIPDA